MSQNVGIVKHMIKGILVENKSRDTCVNIYNSSNVIYNFIEMKLDNGSDKYEIIFDKFDVASSLVETRLQKQTVGIYFFNCTEVLFVQ